jgi:hypothetical protein
MNYVVVLSLVLRAITAAYVTNRDNVYATALLSLSSRMTMVNPTIWLAVFAFVVIFVVHRLWTLQRVLTSVVSLGFFALH